MTEKQLRQRIADAALAWLGKKEADGSFREILAVYNAIRPLPRGYEMKDTDPWCAAFVSAAAAQAGLTEIVFPECSCPRMMALYKAAGRWEEVEFAVPKPGDLVFYDWDGDRAPEHVGLVIAAEGDYVTVIEGNKSDAVGKRRLHLDNKYILGYGQPDYFHYADKLEAAVIARSEATRQSASSEEERIATAPAEPRNDAVGEGLAPPADTETSAGASCARPQESPQTTASVVAGVPDGPQESPPCLKGGGPQGRGDTETLSLPLLALGARGESVRAAQLLLIGRGFGCGRAGADGDFGPDTRGGTLRFQRSRGLASDGEIGPETWAALLGVAA